MANTFSDDIDVLSLHRIVVHGTVDDPSNVAKIEIFLDDKDLGTAHLSANGAWRLAVGLPKLTGAETIRATVTDNAGQQSELAAPFTMLNNPGVAIGKFFQIRGVGAGSFVFNIFNSDGNLIIKAFETVANDKATFSETGTAPNVPFFCLTADQLEFPGSFRADITNFHLTKASHDVLDFSNGPFSTIAQVLRHTSTFQGSATIHLDQNSTVKVEGVTKAQLAQHHDVFFFG